jgi:hypothetical protein
VRAYKGGKVHYEADVVTHDGAAYQATRDTGNAPPHEDWICLARSGEDGSSVKIAGTYDEAATYAKLVVVALNGSSFISRIDNPGKCPGADWQLIASHGKPGIKGSPGERGPAGPMGPSGRNGERGLDAPLIIGWKIDRANFTITPILSDESKAPAINVRELFEQFQIEAR